MSWLIICAAIAAVVIVLLAFVIWISQYNGLVSVNNRCDESWSDVQTELKRRYDLIPNLIKTVKGYAKHERELLTKLTDLREAAAKFKGSPAEQAKAASHFNHILDKLMVRLEAYPDLKASKNFLALHEELTDTEDRIQASLRFYNANVRDMNNKKQQFPSNVVANTHGFKEREYFKVDDKKTAEAMQKPVEVDFE